MLCLCLSHCTESTWLHFHYPCWATVYPKKYAHGFVVLCFVVVMQSFIMNSHEVFIHIHQGCFAGTGAIVRLPQCQWSKLDGYGKISQCITTTKHSKAKTVCIFLGIYCTYIIFLIFYFQICFPHLMQKLCQILHDGSALPMWSHYLISNANYNTIYKMLHLKSYAMKNHLWTHQV